MPLSSDNLLKQLNQRKIIDWALELNNGPESYQFLLTALKEDCLNINQTRNALHALFRIRRHGDSAEVLHAFVESAKNPILGIRSEAIQLVIGVVKFSHLYPEPRKLQLSKDQLRTIKGARIAGLSRKVERLAADFFDKQ